MQSNYRSISILIFLGFIILIISSVLESKGHLPVNENKSLSLLLQFTVLVLIGTIAKYMFDTMQREKELREQKNQKEKEFYINCVNNYNRAKRIRRELKYLLIDADFDKSDLVDIHRDLNHVQLGFEELRDYFIIHDDLYSNQDRPKLYKLLDTMQDALRKVTRSINGYLSKPLKKGEFPAEMKNYALASYSQNDFLTAFHQFRIETYNYEEKKVMLGS